MTNTSTFAWAMAACCMLDILLLFWMLNPFSERMKQVRWYPEASDSAPTLESKPTPLGVAAVQALLRRER